MSFQNQNSGLFAVTTDQQKRAQAQAGATFASIKSIINSKSDKSQKFREVFRAIRKLEPNPLKNGEIIGFFVTCIYLQEYQTNAYGECCMVSDRETSVLALPVGDKKSQAIAALKHRALANIIHSDFTKYYILVSLIVIGGGSLGAFALASQEIVTFTTVLSLGTLLVNASIALAASVGVAALMVAVGVYIAKDLIDEGYKTIGAAIIAVNVLAAAAVVALGATGFGLIAVGVAMIATYVLWKSAKNDMRSFKEDSGKLVSSPTPASSSSSNCRPRSASV